MRPGLLTLQPEPAGQALTAELGAQAGLLMREVPAILWVRAARAAMLMPAVWPETMFYQRRS